MKVSVKVIVLSILILVMSALTVICFITYMKAKTYNDSVTLINMESVGSEAISCKIDVSFITGKIAQKGTLSYYLAGDEKNIFIISTNKKLPNELEEIKKYSYSITDKKPASYRVIGGSYFITDELKSIALNAYNNLFKDQTLNEDEFYDYFGEYYLNIEDIYDDSEDIKLIFFIVFGTITILLLALTIIVTVKK